ncbi:MAG: hypothetical protein FK733_12005 [Asgard group archaeon]|nr:hypothetical protein [Asgard group archaeon]
MKKIFNFLLILSILLSYSIVLVDSDDSFAPILGQSFEYEVLTSNLNIKIGLQTFSVDSYQFGSQQFFIGDPFTIDVTYTNATIAYYDFKCNNISLTSYIVDNRVTREFYFSSYLLEPLTTAHIIYSTFIINGDFSYNLYTNGLLLRSLLFVPANESSWSELQALSDFYNDGYYYTDSFQDLEIISHFNSIDDIVYFECYFQGYSDKTLQTFNQNLFVESCFLIAYNKTNGVLCGYRSFGTTNGRINGDKINCQIELHYEQIDFNLPEFSLYTNTIDSNFITILIFSFTLFVTIIFIRHYK